MHKLTNKTQGIRNKSLLRKIGQVVFHHYSKYYFLCLLARRVLMSAFFLAAPEPWAPVT